VQPSHCPTEAELVAFHRGELPPLEVDRVAGHVEDCPHCEETLQALDAREGSFAAVLRQGRLSARISTVESRPEPRSMAPDPAESVGLGTTIAGRYKLVEPLGEGGMGTVYMAQQIEPVKRLVAIKLIKPGMDSRLILARFEAERQALALMDHPGIARVLDAGNTELGRPFFVMELVKGTPITRYCDDYKLNPRERLELFIQVCQAVQHAHQKGVIHRDLKPSNILVARYDGRPVPKVIDFGVAKAAGQVLTDKTLVTGFGALVGTPEYMAPEQAEMNQLDIDTRSDVYSLGVLLYELLTGNTPLTRQRLRRAALLEVLRLIREEDPPKPSTRLSSADAPPSIAADRAMEPRRLANLVRGELDWIVMKTLEKDRSRRYETADALARDIQRYLADEPVEAGRPSANYRLRKLARKYRGPLRLVVAVATLLVVASFVSIRQARLAGIAARAAVIAAGETKKALDRVVEEEAKAKEELATREAVQRFFLKTVFAAGRPEGLDGALGIGVTLRRAIDAAVPSIAGAFGDRPLIEAAVRDGLGDTYLAVGEPRLAVEQYEQTLRLRTAELGPDHRDTLRSDISLAAAYQEAGRTREALELYEKTLAVLKTALGPDDLDTMRCMNGLAVIYSNTPNRAKEGIPLHRDLLAVRNAKLGPDHPDTLLSMNNLASAYLRDEQNEQATVLFEQTLALRRVRLGPNHPDTLASLHNVALATRINGHLKEAVKLFEETLGLYRAKFGADHPATLRTARNLAESYAQAGDLESAVRTLREVVPLYQAKLGLDHAQRLTVMSDLAIRLGQTDRSNEAIPLFKEVLDRKRAKLGPDDPDTLLTHHALGTIYLVDGREADAVREFGEILALRRARLGQAAPGTIQSINELAEAYYRDERLSDAVRLLEEHLPGIKAELGENHRKTLETMGNLASYHGYQGRFLEAVPSLEEVQRLRKANLGPDDSDTINGMYDLGIAYMKAGRPDRARPLLGDYLARQRKRFVAGDPRLAEISFKVGRAWLEHKAYAESEPLLRDALAIFEKGRPGDVRIDVARSRLGGDLLGQGRYAEAEPLLKAGYEGMRQRIAKIPRLEKTALPEAADWLSRLYEATGKPDEAAKWRVERAKYSSRNPMP
jgi:eukaryotic-like serine/threonine-protein kinase